MGSLNELFILEIFITLHSCSFESIISLNGILSFHRFQRWKQSIPLREIILSKEQLCSVMNISRINSSFKLPNYNELFIQEMFIKLHSRNILSFYSIFSRATPISWFSLITVAIPVYVWSNHVLTSHREFTCIFKKYCIFLFANVLGLLIS